MIKFEYNNAKSPSQEKNDCTVRALAIATNSSYHKCYDLLWRAGRKPNKGFHIKRFLKKSCSYMGHSFLKLNFRKPITLRKFIMKYSSGIYYVRIRAHVFVVKDGIVLDMFEQSPYCRITDAWKVINNSCF
jgi:hypothetical protein